MKMAVHMTREDNSMSLMEENVVHIGRDRPGQLQYDSLDSKNFDSDADSSV
jgi:hypothetical protein